MSETQVHLHQFEPADIDRLMAGEPYSLNGAAFRFVRLLAGTVPTDRLHGVGPLYEPALKRWTLGLYTAPSDAIGVEPLDWPTSTQPKIKMAELQLELLPTVPA